MKYKFFLLTIVLFVLTSCKLRGTEKDTYDDIVDSVQRLNNENLVIEGSMLLRIWLTN